MFQLLTLKMLTDFKYSNNLNQIKMCNILFVAFDIFSNWIFKSWESNINASNHIVRYT